jgi:hypothetical protein
MDKRIVIAGIACCALAAAIAAAKKSAQAGPKPEVWDKMRAKMEEMPEDFPPRVMYDNIEATKANTDKILELLQQGEG